MSDEAKLDELLDRVKQLQDTLIDVSRQHLLQIQRILGILEPERNPPGQEHKQLGYPALYLDATANKVFVKKAVFQPLEEILRGAEYHLFRHIIELLQVRELATHWAWGFIIWPEWCKDPPNSPEKAFGIQCSRLRKQVEKAWKLGTLLGKGTRHSSNIPIEIVAEHFSTEAKSEGSAHPVWAVFLSHDQFQKACKTQQWEQAHRHLIRLLDVDPENLAGNLGLCRLAIDGHTSVNAPLVQRAISAIHKKLTECRHAFDKIRTLAEEPLDQYQWQSLRERLDALASLGAKLPQANQPLESSINRKPWRSREEFAIWATLLAEQSPNPMPGDGIALNQAMLSAEREVVRGLLLSLQGYFHGIRSEDLKDYLQQFVSDLAVDSQNWPDDNLPASKTAFTQRARDYIVAKIFDLSDDGQSKGITKAQNLRRLWGRRAELRKEFEREPTTDELYRAGRELYSWSTQFFNDLITLERSRQTQFFDDARSYDGRLDNSNDDDYS